MKQDIVNTGRQNHSTTQCYRKPNNRQYFNTEFSSQPHQSRFHSDHQSQFTDSNRSRNSYRQQGAYSNADRLIQPVVIAYHSQWYRQQRYNQGRYSPSDTSNETLNQNYPNQQYNRGQQQSPQPGKVRFNLNNHNRHQSPSHEFIGVLATYSSS